jgi:hypothetical protein
VPEEQRDLVPLWTRLDAEHREIAALMLSLVASRKEIAMHLSTILGVDLIHKQPLVSVIGSAVRRIADLP